MTMPNNLTHAEVGAFLVAIGQHMIDFDVCADAVIEPSQVKDLEYAHTLINSMQEASWSDDIEDERCEEILLNLTLIEAIEFNTVDKAYHG